MNSKGSGFQKTLTGNRSHACQKDKNYRQQKEARSNVSFTHNTIWTFFPSIASSQRTCPPKSLTRRKNVSPSAAGYIKNINGTYLAQVKRLLQTNQPPKITCTFQTLFGRRKCSLMIQEDVSPPENGRIESGYNVET